MSLGTSLAHGRFRNNFHACAFVKDAAEEREVIEPFLIEGMRQGQKGDLYRRS